MAKLAWVIMLIFISLVAAMPWVQGLKNGSNQEVTWVKRLDAEKETTTNLQFYFHDTVSGKKPSAVRVAQAPDTEKSSTLFGAVFIADDPLTEGPEPTSKLLGKAQGLYGSAGQAELSLIMAMSFVFTDGMYDGSSVSILGSNQALHPVRELPVVGGTGVFRFARGYAIAQTHWIDITTGDAIVGYNVTIVH